MALVIAHRGYHRNAVENTLDAFERAIDLGVDMIELDVQEARDGDLLVFHDDTIDSTPIDTLSTAAIHEQVPDGVAPRLADVLEAIGDRIALDIEVKAASPTRVATALQGSGDRHVLSSFDARVVRELADLAPSRRRGLIVSAADERYASVEGIIREAEAAQADFVSLDAPLARPDTLAALASKVGPSLVWAADDADALERLLADTRVAGVITDHPELALSLRPRTSLRTAPAAVRHTSK